MIIVTNCKNKNDQGLPPYIDPFSFIFKRKSRSGDATTSVFIDYENAKYFSAATGINQCPFE